MFATYTGTAADDTIIGGGLRCATGCSAFGGNDTLVDGELPRSLGAGYASYSLGHPEGLLRD